MTLQKKFYAGLREYRHKDFKRSFMLKELIVSDTNEKDKGVIIKRAKLG